MTSLLHDALNAWDPCTQDVAFMELDELGPEGAIAFAKALKYGRVRARESAAWVLGRRGQEAEIALPELIEALKDESDTVRGRAAGALGNIGPNAKAAISLLRDRLNDTSIPAQLAAAEAIYRLEKDDAVIPVLVRGLSNHSEYIRMQAAASLIEIGQINGAEEVLIDILENGTYYNGLRRKAACALEAIALKSPKALEALRRGTNDPEWLVFTSATESLIKLDQEVNQCIPKLVETLTHYSLGMRRWAAETLGKLGPRAAEAIPALIKAGTDTDDEVRQAAAEALRRIQGE